MARVNTSLISVVVCHHTGALLFDFLESVFKSENVIFEVIVMTSNKELAKEGIKDCMVFHHEGLPAEKRNAGARVASGGYLAFFDDDVVIDSLCLYHLKDGIQNDIAMTYGKLWNMERRNRFDEAGGFLTWTGFLWSRAGQNDEDVGQFSKPETILSGKSASCMVRADVFRQLKGFDEDFGILGEETDLSWRIWLSGKKVLYVPQATGYHAFNCPTIKPPKKYYANTRVFFNGPKNYIAMLYKNLETKNLFLILPIHISIWIITLLMFILTGKYSCGILILKGVFHNVKNIKSLHYKRKIIQAKRNRKDKDIFAFIIRTPRLGYFFKRLFKYRTTGLHG